MSDTNFCTTILPGIVCTAYIPQGCLTTALTPLQDAAGGNNVVDSRGYWKAPSGVELYEGAYTITWVFEWPKSGMAEALLVECGKQFLRDNPDELEFLAHVRDIGTRVIRIKRSGT